MNCVVTKVFHIYIGFTPAQSTKINKRKSNVKLHFKT